jgi:hypothetical protein
LSNIVEFQSPRLKWLGRTSNVALNTTLNRMKLLTVQHTKRVLIMPLNLFNTFYLNVWHTKI